MAQRPASLPASLTRLPPTPVPRRAPPAPRRAPAPRAFIAVLIKASVLHLLSVSFHATRSFHLHRTLCPPSSPFPWAVECGAQADSLGYGVSLSWAAGRHPADLAVVARAGMGAGTWAQTQLSPTPAVRSQLPHLENRDNPSVTAGSEGRTRSRQPQGLAHSKFLLPAVAALREGAP